MSLEQADLGLRRVTGLNSRGWDLSTIVNGLFIQSKQLGLRVVKVLARTPRRDKNGLIVWLSRVSP